ncbi:MAG: hypothetical protein Q9190_006283, partial [Brigantiaea leucoxantha]
MPLLPAKSSSNASPEPIVEKKRKRSQPADGEEIEVDINAPEPPSKKAARKAKKGSKVLPPPVAVSSTEDINHSPVLKHVAADDDPVTHPKRGDSKRSEHGIWIGNLSFTVTKSDLRDFLVKKAHLTDTDITRVHMPLSLSPTSPATTENTASSSKSKAQHNKGFAHIDFATGQAVTQALALSETLLSGRRVLIKDTRNFQGRPEKKKQQEGKGGMVKTTGGGKGKLPPPSRRVF